MILISSKSFHMGLLMQSTRSWIIQQNWEEWIKIVLFFHNSISGIDFCEYDRLLQRKKIKFFFVSVFSLFDVWTYFEFSQTENKENRIKTALFFSIFIENLLNVNDVKKINKEIGEKIRIIAYKNLQKSFSR